jgi:predicted dehydrogenase
MHIAVVGLGFGEAFVPIYSAHPLVDRVSVCDVSQQRMDEIASRYEISTKYDNLDAVLDDDDIDAVHLLTPLFLHAEQSIDVLAAGKHCACAVTMANSVRDLYRVVQATRDSGKNYMMMETGVYTREFLFAQDMVRNGEIGDITLLRGDYYQDLEAPYPEYWRRVPPMHYATHVLGPLLALVDTRATKVSCIGGGQLRKDICDDARNPFPLQIAQFRLEGHDAAVQVNRAWYQTAHEYVESFSVYGSRKGFEWQQLESEDPVIFELEPVQQEHRWRGCPGKRHKLPFHPDRLPLELGEFADGGHGGSHAHLVHEFVSCVTEGRSSKINEITAANWSAAGICAHESSLQEGAWVEIPSFD